MSADPTGFVTDLLAAVNSHDLDALAGCFGPDYVNETPAHPARGFAGVEQVRRNWSAIFGAVPDIRAEVTAQAVDGEVIWTEWRMAGRRPDGLPHEMRGVVIFTVSGRRARAARFYLEPLDNSADGVDSAVARAVGTAP